MLNPYTKEDDERLLRYIATYNPERTGRSGNKLYQDLVAQHKRWPWSNRHPWSSWRERYVKHNKEFDKKISDWQKAHADRPGTLTNLKKSSQREKPSITARPPAAKTAKGTSSTGAPRPVKATINDNGKRGRSSIGQSTSQSLKRPRLQTTASEQNVENAIRPAVVKKPSPTTTASKGKEKARPMSDSETEPESEGPAGPDDYNYKGQVFEKEEEEEEENTPQEMETDGAAAETPARSQSIWNDIPRGSKSPEPVADSRRVSPTIAAPLAAVSEIPVIAATPPRALVSTAQTNRPIIPKPDGDQELHISQEPTPPRSGVSETPQGSPASSSNGRLEANTPYSQHSVLRITELTNVGLEHLHTISVHGSSSPVTERPTIPAPRRRTFFKVRQIEPEDIFETASSNGSPAAAPPRKQREPPRLIEGPYVSSFADSSGASRLTSGGRRTNGAVDQSDESESEADERPPDPNWPPRRGSMKDATHAKPAITETSPQTIIAADSTAVSRVSSSSKDGASVQRAPAVPAMKHVLEKCPTRATFPRPPQVNAEASSSKVKLPGPSQPATRASPTSTAYGTDEPVKFPRTAASKPSAAAPVPRASSLARTKDPFSKDFIRTDTESDGSAKAAVEKGKTKAKLMIDRRQTFSGVPPLDTVPHLDLANEVRKREHQRSNGRQSAPLIDLRARRASLAASRSSTSASDEHRPRRNSTPSAFSFDQGPRRASSIASSRASAKPTSVADMRRLSAAPHDMQLAVQESLEGVLQRLGQNHGFDETVARRIWERMGDFRRTDKALRIMRERAQEALDQLLGDELDDEGEEAEDEEQEEDDEEQGEEQQEEEQDAEAEEEADVAMLVNPSRSASDRSASPPHRTSPLRVSIPRASVSPVRASNGFEYTPLPESEQRPAHYSPASPTRARQYNRLVRAGRAEEARLREIRRASRGYVMGTTEAGAQGGSHAEEVEEGALEDGDVEMYDYEAEGDGWDAKNAARAFEEQEREDREREEREERERAAAGQERMRREMEKAAERRAEKARRAQERSAAAEERRLREEAEQERAESEQRQRLERGRLERAQMERERLERARVERERMERERVERAQREREQKQRMERERLEQEHRERVEQERAEMEQRERAQRAQLEREEAQRREREEEQEVAESTANVEPSYEMDLNPEADIPEEQIQSPTNEQYFGDEDSDGLIGEKEDYLPGPLRPSSPLVQESQRSGGSQQGHDGTPEPRWTEEDYFTLFNGDTTELRALAERVGPRSIKWQIADAYAELVGN